MITDDLIIILQSTTILIEIKSRRIPNHFFCRKHCKKNDKDFLTDKKGVKYGSLKGGGDIRQGVTKTHARQNTMHDICIGQCILSK